MKGFLALCIVALGGGILWVGSGAVGPFVSSIVRGVGSFVAQVGAVAGSPSPSQNADAPEAPSIAPPDQPYTNHATIDVTVNVPSDYTGKDGYLIRLWVTPKDEDAVQLAEQEVGATAQEVIPGVKLAQGRNDLQASIVGPGGESDRSEVVTWILDTSKPKVSVISPKDGSQVNKTSVTIKGKSQALAEVRLQNAANNAIATVKAGKDGLWTARVGLSDGRNVISITAKDPAGNVNTMTLSLRKGSGKLVAALSASAYRFKASRLPRSITLTVEVTGPDGRPLAGAVALFTVSVPGVEAIVSGEITTNANGVATFRTSIPSGATPGSGLADVLITTKHDGTATDRQVITVGE
jgi:type II secretory pathway pseudopilin PulG